MPHQVTVTAKTGPAVQVTGAVLPAVTRVDFDLNDKVLQVYQDPTQGTSVKEYDLAGVTVVTFAIVAGNFSIVVS